MGRGTRQKKEETLRAVAEALVYGFSEKQALVFIEARLGRPISGSHYRTCKHWITSEEANNVWLNRHARSGFVYNLRRRIDLIEMQCSEIMRDILAERSKQADGKGKGGPNMWLIMRYKDSLAEYIRLAHELDAASPIAAKLMAMVVYDKVQEQKKHKEAGDDKLDPELVENLYRYYQSN
jgi:hypothetical protein